MKRVRLSRVLASPEGTFAEGTIMEISDARADELEKLGALVVLEPELVEEIVEEANREQVEDPDKLETATAAPDAETPEAPQGRARRRGK